MRNNLLMNKKTAMAIKGEITIPSATIWLIMSSNGENDKFINKFCKYLGNLSELYLEVADVYMTDYGEFNYFGTGCHRILWAILKAFSEMKRTLLNEYYVDVEESMIEKKRQDEEIMELGEEIKKLELLQNVLKGQKFTCKIEGNDEYSITFYH